MTIFAGKLVLAPMVRAGELPTRLLSLQHGADLVWSPEIVDKKLIQTIRTENTRLNTIDFVMPSSQGRDPTIVFRTLPEKEHGKLIFQIGTANAELAVEAASKVIDDVDGIDLNAGCPKHFSIHSGMGAALLSTPDLLCNILSGLVTQVGKPHNKPISCKIRLLETIDDTLALVERICNTGITNLTVHCRTREMRNREAPRWTFLKPIETVCDKHGVSLIMNGGIKEHAHFHTLREEYGLSDRVGGMIAEHAETNPTVFDTPATWMAVTQEYIALAKSMDNNFGNTKYMLGRIIPGKKHMYQYMTRCKDYIELDYLVSKMDPTTGECYEDPTPHLETLRKPNKSQKKQNTKRKLNNTTPVTETQNKRHKDE